MADKQRVLGGEKLILILSFRILIHYEINYSQQEILSESTCKSFFKRIGTYFSLNFIINVAPFFCDSGRSKESQPVVNRKRVVAGTQGESGGNILS
jgi:hypothetical protein